MKLHDFPAAALGLIMATYWSYVLWMVWRVRRDARRISRVLVPAQRREKFMWLIWVPVISGWISVPFESGFHPPSYDYWKGLPAFAAGEPSVLALRYAALACAIGLLSLSIVCWRHMGKDWRMGVDPEAEGRLIVDGPFGWVRHPIYALSIALMCCSVVIVLARLMFVIAAAHVALMLYKVRNEERFMREKYGPAYDEYCRRTGRLFPQFGAAASAAGPPG